MSADDDDETLEKAIDCGMVSLVKKPLNKGVLT
jgi:hypothetical protein